MFDAAVLTQVWREILAKDMQDGVMAVGVSRFAEHAERRIDELATQLAEGTYLPSALTPVEIVTGDKVRLLHVPTVRDRIVERAVLKRVTPLVDPHLGPCAYAYRPGLGVADAVQAVVTLRDEGGTHALRTDVDECFPSIPVDTALAMFEELVTDHATRRLVRQFVKRTTRHTPVDTAERRGLALGCALSPMLTNLVLSHLDEALLDAGYFPVRYADDVAVVTERPQDARNAAEIATEALKGLGMSLGEDKTEVMSFQEGFCFLGEDFGVKYPPSALAGRANTPDKRVVYVGMQGSHVRVTQGRLRVDNRDDVAVLDVPTGHVSRIVTFGSVGFSAGVRNWAFSQGIDSVFATRTGTYVGQLTSASENPELAVVMARAVAEAKIVKQRIVLRRFARPEHRDVVGSAADAMKTLLGMLPGCATVDEVRGIEGAAAREYFPAYGSLFPPDLTFEIRSRRPPMDVANAALSYLYTVLLGECVTAARTAGMDPSLGFLHADDGDRPSLALDLMEEFRPLVVDQVVLAAARNNTLKIEHGRQEQGRTGVLLTKAGRTSIVQNYETRMLQPTHGALADFRGTLRRHLYRQSQRMVRTILDPGHPWTGMSWR